MKVVGFVGLALGVGMLALNTPEAFADASATPKPNPSSSFDAAMLQYKIDMQTYRTQMFEREKIRREITKRFIAAVVQANKTAKSGIASATTPESKAIIISVQKNSVALAVVARDNAILSMALAPIQPIKPIRAEVSKVKSRETPSKPGSSG